MKRNSPTKGLILYEIYCARGNIYMMLTVSLLLGLLLLTTGNIHLLQFLVGVSITLIPSLFMINTAKHSTSRWNRYQLAMPVKRKDVIDSNYIGHLLILAASIMFAAVFTVLNEILHENFFATKNILFLIFMISCGISLTGCGLFYPFAYMIGRKSEEACYVASLLVALAMNLFIVGLGYKANLSKVTVGVVCIAVSATLFVVSYVITSRLYAKKDL